MSDTITICELSDLEIEELNTIKNFKEFGPVECNNCGFKGSFIRRLFHVENIGDDSDRGIIRWHLKQKYNLEYCVFRTAGTRELVESAHCPKCKSNNIIFDISPKLLVELIKKSRKYFK
jgi:predicted Zn-ribbon and HTH transcriptional regulator